MEYAAPQLRVLFSMLTIDGFPTASIYDNAEFNACMRADFLLQNMSQDESTQALLQYYYKRFRSEGQT